MFVRIMRAIHLRTGKGYVSLEPTFFVKLVVLRPRNAGISQSTANLFIWRNRL